MVTCRSAGNPVAVWILTKGLKKNFNLNSV